MISYYSLVLYYSIEYYMLLVVLTNTKAQNTSLLHILASFLLTIIDHY